MIAPKTPEKTPAPAETGTPNPTYTDNKNTVRSASRRSGTPASRPRFVRRRPAVRKKSTAARIALLVLRRVALVLFTVILVAVLALYGVCAVVFYGPSPSARDKLVTSTLEMSAAKFVPRLFFSQAEIDAIVQNNQVVDVEDITDPGLVDIPSNENDDPDHESDEWKDYPEGIRLETIRGTTYRGYVMIIRDPSRVYVATSSDFTGDAPGLRIHEAVAKEEAIAAINAGGFPDDGGVGLGNVPIGLTISKGRLLWGGDDMNRYHYGVVGFDQNHVLIVGNMTPRQALNRGIRDCVCFGPILVVNGEPATIRGDSGSLNPRTAIGQRKDGAVIFLCVDGRMPNSLGASYADLINIMVEYGAVNAINLDGGSSTHMVYKGEHINVSSSLYGPRRMPTFFMVKP